jgi:signal transduction histidine kinase
VNYFRKNSRFILAICLVILAFNLYFIYLIPRVSVGYLIYLDWLIVIGIFIFISIDVYKYRKKEKQKKELLELDSIVCDELGVFENNDIVKHDVEILKRQLQEQYDSNCNLQDYITKWCHEVKIPLAVSLLMVEKIDNTQLKRSMQEQLEKINQQLNAALLGCKVQSNLFDMNIQVVELMKCVRASIKNNQFFLIRNHFELDVKVEQLSIYTDKSWLVYVLDQLLNNAVKYAKDNPMIKIWSEGTQENVQLLVEDYGEGIKDSDIHRIFEKGFTGSNHHNGRYKSTGMGLYMVSIILKKLGHEIRVESEYGKFTRFIISFSDNREFFNICH